MRRSNRGYDSYRGRRTATDVLKYIAIFLAVVVVLALGILLWAQEYIVYTDDGWHIQLFQEEPAAGLPDPGSVSYTELPKEELPQEVEETPMRALQLPVEAVVNGSAQAQLEEAGADALVLEMKDQEGNLAWHTQQEIADLARVNGDESINQALEQWLQGDVYTVALVCCYRDNSVPYHQNGLALRGYGGNWRDELGLRWLSPAVEGAREYVAALCGELAALGFDEIVLECAGFPIRGDLSGIDRGPAYDPEQLTAAVEQSLEQIAQATEGYGAAVSLRVDWDTLEGGETSSGFTSQLLEEYSHRLWIEEDDAGTVSGRFPEQFGLSGGEKRMVMIRAALSEGNDTAQAVLRNRP